ncbi:alpha/beta hydrolase [uncultured Roseobacter sp.]|uniref:alpha/beta fold hydrolase n=1 Tax=uncultured Roseobacter sp. TaxID=114847 RepID=UPI00262F368A|nr:alpha/beta hydrolase [uncultured Roseobacter sp.]
MAADGSGAVDGLIYDPAEVERAAKLVILIPGALARLEIFAPVQHWRARGYALVSCPFPGLDGRPVTPGLRIDAAAACIAEFAERHPGKPYRLLGYSTGGPIAISAAERMGDADVRVAAMSSAVERAGGIATARRTTADLLAAAARVRSVRRRTVWLEYYKTLLFGRRVRRDSALDARATALVAARMEEMVYPDRDLLAAHTEDLRRWRLPSGPRLAEDRLQFFVGAEDPVFSSPQTAALAARFGAPRRHSYAGQGHLLFLTAPRVFEDILAYFEAVPG